MVNTAAAILIMGQHFINFTPNFVNNLFVVAVLIMFMSTAQVHIHCLRDLIITLLLGYHPYKLWVCQ